MSVNDQAMRTYARKAVRACAAHARDLLDSARQLGNVAPMRHVAYVLAVAALEEIGKAELVKMAAARTDFDTVEEAATWAANRADDHVEKLFWALWGPTFGRETITGSQIAREKETARLLHQARKDAAYVSLAIGAPTPRSTVTAAQIRRMLELVDARLGLLGRPRFLKPAPDVEEQLKWFTDLTDNPEGRAHAMSPESMRKLAELGDAGEWMQWLRAQEEDANRVAASILAEEKARRVATGTPKWRVKSKMFSPGLSIRPKPLAAWNKAIDHIKLGAGSSNRVLTVELTLRDDVHVDALPNVFTGVLTRLFLSLNIGTLSLFIWEESDYQAKFCDSIHDLERDTELKAIPSSPGPVDWGRRALNDTDMQDVKLAMAAMPFPGDPEFEPFELYRQAMMCLAKADVHLNLVPTAVDELRRSMASALRRLGGWDGSGPMEKALQARVGDILDALDDEEDRDLVIERASGTITELEKALKIKMVVDALLIRSIRDRAAALWKVEREPGEARGKTARVRPGS